MELRIFTVALAMIFMIGTPATAEEQKNNVDKPEVVEYSSEELKDNWTSIKEKLSAASTANSENNKGKAIEAALIDEESQGPEIVYTNFNSNKTATNIIGRTVYSDNQQKIGTIEDIIVDGNNKAVMVVIADHQLEDIGRKMSAFDYETVIKSNENGNHVMPLAEETIKNPPAFSYNHSGESIGVRAIPENGYGVAKLLERDIINPNSEPIAKVDNVIFNNGEIQKLVIIFNQILGMGGDRAILDYNKVELVSFGNRLGFQLNEVQAAQFENYRQTVTAN